MKHEITLAEILPPSVACGSEHINKVLVDFN
jgi:hypothetical protein